MPSDATPKSALVAHDDWCAPLPENVPRPTYWPAVLAFGLVAAAFGIVTTVVISALGLAICVVAIAGWISELRHEH